MRTKRISRTIVFLGCAASLIAATASAQTWDKKVYYTFSGTVEIPGAVLPAGQYLFHLADPDASRQIIRVQSTDGKEVFSTFFTMPVQRPDVPDEAEARLMEAAPGVPPAISTLWYVGERTGREPIYPKDQAVRIAKATSQSVLTTKADTTKADEARSGDLARVSPSGEDIQFSEKAAVEAPSGRTMKGSTGEPAAPVAQVAQNEPRRSMGAGQNENRRGDPVGTAGQTPASPARNELPATASSTPTQLLLGLGLISAAAALRFRRAARIPD
jgi:hypothetical protein